MHKDMDILVALESDQSEIDQRGKLIISATAAASADVAAGCAREMTMAS